MNQNDNSQDFWYVMPCILVNVCQFVTNQHNLNSYKNRIVTNTAVVTTKPSKFYGFYVLRLKEKFNTDVSKCIFMSQKSYKNCEKKSVFIQTEKL